jgi:hypothetical protein
MEEVNLHSSSNAPFFEMQSKSKEAKSCLVLEKVAQDSIASLSYSSCHCHYINGKKGIIKLQALYQMQNLVFFTCNDKEMRALVLKVLEVRVPPLQQNPWIIEKKSGQHTFPQCTHNKAHSTRKDGSYLSTSLSMIQ